MSDPDIALSAYCYITPRIIAMAMPSSTANEKPHIDGSAVPLGAASAALRAAHGSSFIVINASERKYDYEKIGGAVVEIEARGHVALPLPTLCRICCMLDTWFGADEQNVAAVHCRTGRGRTNVIIVAYLVWSGQACTSSAALELLSRKRGVPQTQLVMPSQARYLQMFQQLLEGHLPCPAALQLRSVILGSAPAFVSLNDGAGDEECNGNRRGVRPVLRVMQDGQEVFCSLTKVQAQVHQHHSESEHAQNHRCDAVALLNDAVTWVDVDGGATFKLPKHCFVRGDVVLQILHAELEAQSEADAHASAALAAAATTDCAAAAMEALSSEQREQLVRAGILPRPPPRRIKRLLPVCHATIHSGFISNPQVPGTDNGYIGVRLQRTQLDGIAPNDARFETEVAGDGTSEGMFLHLIFLRQKPAEESPALAARSEKETLFWAKMAQMRRDSLARSSCVAAASIAFPAMPVTEASHGSDPGRTCTERAAARRRYRHAELVEFYKTRAPLKIGAVDRMLTMYEVCDIAASLRHKYGAVPAGWADLRQQLVEFYAVCNPDKVKGVDDLLNGHPAPDLVASLRKTYGTVPCCWADLGEQLAYFYRVHNQEKERDASAILRSYPFSLVALNLREAYGAVPDGWEAIADVATAQNPAAYTGAGESVVMDADNGPGDCCRSKSGVIGTFCLRASLAEFFALHNPVKVADVDALLRSYPFEDIAASLRAKYNGQLPAGWALGRAQLVRFYREHNPDKVPCVDQLLRQYSFGDIAASLLTTYETVPAGWRAVAQSVLPDPTCTTAAIARATTNTSDASPLRRALLKSSPVTTPPSPAQDFAAKAANSIQIESKQDMMDSFFALPHSVALDATSSSDDDELHTASCSIDRMHRRSEDQRNAKVLENARIVSPDVEELSQMERELGLGPLSLFLATSGAGSCGGSYCKGDNITATVPPPSADLGGNIAFEEELAGLVNEFDELIALQ